MRVRRRTLARDRGPSTRRRRVAAVVLAACWLIGGCAGAFVYVHRYDLYRGFPTPQLPTDVPPGRTLDVQFHSAALGRRNHFYVWLPPGYRAGVQAGRRYPVMYLLHGAPGDAHEFFSTGEVAVRAAELIHAHLMPPTILAIPGGKEGIFGVDTEWANTSSGRYEAFLMNVVHQVDKRFATLRRRRDRVLAGLSEGGYAAVNVGLHHLGTFGGVQSWSGYFTQSAAGPFAGSGAGLVRANDPVAYTPALAPKIRQLGLRAYLYQGNANRDPFALTRYARELHAAGAAVSYAYFPGGHDWALWRAQMPHMFELAGRWFRQPPRLTPNVLVHVGHPLPPAQLRAALRRSAHLRHIHRAAKLARFRAQRLHRREVRAARHRTAHG
jgi:enterochelin esterase-like enzyme